MSSDGLERIFQSKKEQVDQFITKWEHIKNQIIENFSEERTVIFEELDALDEANQMAYKKMVEKLECPTISIATTGTTSSGKSTVVNMLCGHEIMPVLATEMSAGVVTINHSEIRVLRILDTPAAVWECGEWYNLTDDEIRQKLMDAMEQYNDKRDTADEPACPLIELDFPTRIGLHSDMLGIPKNFKIKILDLPGLKFVGDNGNMKVIRNCREALCLVTYNSDETDEKLQENLLKEVVNQVKELGGSPARMLFILNKIDVFLRDENPIENQNKFVDKIGGRIKRELLKALPEYENGINGINTIKLSSLPALLSLKIRNNEKQEERYVAAKKIDDIFGGLIPEEIIDDLPRRVDRWKDIDFARVSDAVWSTSYAQEFEEYFKDHIEQNIPELVLPQIIDRFRSDIRIEKTNQNCVEWGLHVVRAEMNSSEERYRTECVRLEDIERLLENERQQAAEDCRKPFYDIAHIIESYEGNDLTDKITNILQYQIKETQAYQNLPDNVLAPLIEWQDEIGRTVDNFLGEVALHLDAGNTSLQGSVFDALPAKERRALSEVCGKLSQLEYHKKQGNHIKTKDSQEKTQLRELNTALHELAKALADAINIIVKKVAEREKNRIYSSLEIVADEILSYIWKKAEETAPELGFGVPPALYLNLADTDLKFDFNFTADFKLKEEIKEELSGYREVWKGTERIWWTLWIVKRDVYESEPEYKKVAYDNADIPKIDILVENWINQYLVILPRVVKNFALWQKSQIDNLNKVIEESQKELVANYKKKLDEAYEYANTVHNEESEKLTSVYTEAQKLEQELKILSRLS